MYNTFGEFVSSRFRLGHPVLVVIDDLELGLLFLNGAASLVYK